MGRVDRLLEGILSIESIHTIALLQAVVVVVPTVEAAMARLRAVELGLRHDLHFELLDEASAASEDGAGGDDEGEGEREADPHD